MEARYVFAPEFLQGGSILARNAQRIEDRGKRGEPLSDDDKTEHRALVVGSIVQACASLESEIMDVAMQGPGAHLGSSGGDADAQRFLAYLADAVDDAATLDRYALVLHLMRKPMINRNDRCYQQASLLIKLRNELIHCKSRWSAEGDHAKLIGDLEALQLEPPPFVPAEGKCYFPHQCLSAALARWSVRTAFEFLDDFYEKFGTPDAVERYRHLVAA